MQAFSYNTIKTLIWEVCSPIKLTEIGL